MTSPHPLLWAFTAGVFLTNAAYLAVLDRWTSATVAGVVGVGVLLAAGWLRDA